MVDMRPMRGNPYDGHTLTETAEQVEILSGKTPKTVIVNRGYQAFETDGVEILRSGQKRGIA